jgi:hypothetical protein
MLRVASAASFGIVAGLVLGYLLGKRRSGRRHRSGLLDCIGETALVELKSLSRALGRSVFVKLEMLNVGGTSKDRAAKQMLLDAKLKPGQTVYEVVESESGSKSVCKDVIGFCRKHWDQFDSPCKSDGIENAHLHSVRFWSQVVLV